MIRSVAIAAALAAAVAAPFQGAAPRALLMPGVVYSRSVEFTPHGPVVVHVLTAPRPGGLYALKPVLAGGAIVGRERLTAIERDVSSQATVAGVNGDFFGAGGKPNGIVLSSGVLDAPAAAGRSSIGVGVDGSLQVDHIAYSGFWKGTGQRRPLALNVPPDPSSSVTLYTSAWGPVTPAAQGTVEAVLGSLPPTVPGTDLSGVVTDLHQGGPTAIPRGGAVLVGRGAGAGVLAAEAPAGTTVLVRVTLTPGWSGIAAALGGGPLLVRDGRPVFRAYEDFATAELSSRTPRSAVGQLADGSLLLVTVDGLQPGYSVGMTNFELALTLVRLGAVTAAGLGTGSPAAMAFDGSLLNRPADRTGESAIADALLVFYYGVYAAPPVPLVVSPNGDGVADQETLTYKVVRPSTVTARVSGPGGAVFTLDQGARQPGVYHLVWSARGAGGGPVPEGGWRFSVVALDDGGRRSAAERGFAVNDTLGSLNVAPQTLGRGRLAISFVLAHAARVTARVQTLQGVVVATLLPGARTLQPGAVHLGWNGKGVRVRPFLGRYVIFVSAANAIGHVELVAPFQLRR